MLIDIVIILLCIGAVRRGYHVGFLHQVFGISGFFIGLFLGAWIQPHIVPHIGSQDTKSAVTVGLTLGLALVFVLIGEELGIRLKRRLRTLKYNRYDAGAGSVLNFFSILMAVWLFASLASGLSWWSLQVALQQSHIVSALNRTLPSSPNIMTNIGNIISPDGFPKVFVGHEPKQSGSVALPAASNFDAVIAQSTPSVFKVMGQGCGGIVDGSGFVISHNLVATNAHVIAGIKQPYVQNDSGVHKATPIWLDPALDFAILRTTDVEAASLTLAKEAVPNKTDAVILGYPGGGDFTVSTAVIANHFVATGRDIYGQQRTARSIYDVRSEIVPGNSGGPVIADDGSVIGVVFAESTSYQKTGYALTAGAIGRSLTKAIAANQVRSTGSCVE